MNKMTYSEKADRLKAIAKEACKARIITQNAYDDFVSRIRNNKFKITVVGEFSSGKSTLIDALIGKDILPHSTSETTATLTYIHNVEHGHIKENKAEIFYADGKTELLDFSTLKEYVTAFSKTVDVFSSIEYVDIYVHIENFDDNIVIVDTPGLNGTHSYEDRTLNEIAHADASIFVFSPSGIKATEQSFMKEELLKHQKSFFFVMNRIDELHQSEGDDVDEKLKELGSEISHNFFNGKQTVSHLYGVSALKALVAKDTNIEKLYFDDAHLITEEDRRRYWNDSRFEQFLVDLRQYLINEKETVFINSIAIQLLNTFEEKLEQINQNLIANAPKAELPAAAIIQDEMNTAQSRFDNYKKELSKNVNARMENVEKHLKEILQQIIAAGKQRLESVRVEVDKIDTIEDFETKYGKDGSKSSNIINSFYDRYFEKLKSCLSNDIEDVRDEILIEIRQLIPNIIQLKKETIPSINIGKKKFESQLYNTSSTIQVLAKHCAECDKKISHLREEEKRTMEIRNRNNGKRSQIMNKIRNVRVHIETVKEKLRRLGLRPNAQLVTNTREIKTERSRFNLKRLIFRDKYKITTEEYTDYDYTAQNRYDRQYNEISREKESLQRQLAELKRQMEKFPDMTSQLELLARKKEQEVRKKNDNLAEMKKENDARERQMAAGKKAFLNSRKKELMNMMGNFLEDESSELHRALSNDAKNCIVQLRENLEDVIDRYFDEGSNNYMAQLQKMLDNVTSKIANREIEQKRNALNVNKNKIVNLKTEIETIII